LSLEVQGRDSGVAGSIVNAQAGLGLNYRYYDVKLTAYVDGGYNFMGVNKMFGEIGLRAQKALTKNTYAGIGLGVLIPGGGRVIQAFTGFTF